MIADHARVVGRGELIDKAWTRIEPESPRRVRRLDLARRWSHDTADRGRALVAESIAHDVNGCHPRSAAVGQGDWWIVSDNFPDLSVGVSCAYLGTYGRSGGGRQECVGLRIALVFRGRRPSPSRRRWRDDLLVADADVERYGAVDQAESGMPGDRRSIGRSRSAAVPACRATCLAVSGSSGIQRALRGLPLRP